MQFPLPNGSFLINPADCSYCADGMASRHAADFLGEQKFVSAYQAAIEPKPGTEIQWRMHVILWAASHALQLQGDFVECGVYIGAYSKAICEYHQFGDLSDRKMFLFDTYDGMVEEQLNEAEREWLESRGLPLNNYESDYFELTKSRFDAYPNVQLIKGIVPDSLDSISFDKIAYLSVDMNCAAPEIAAGEYLWPHLVSGAIIVLDDYGFGAHRSQKVAWDEFAARRGLAIMSCPTGQGILIKP